MDSLSGGTAEVQKQALMNQVRQQAALQNAQQLVEVHILLPKLPLLSITRLLTPPRKSTKPASRNAYPSLAHRSPTAKRHVTNPAWRNI